MRGALDVWKSWGCENVRNLGLGIQVMAVGTGC